MTTHTIEQEPPLIDVPLVQGLVAEQFPHWADLPIRPVAYRSWSNRTFHLGDEMVVRLPRAHWYAAQIDKEQQWLPRLAPQLPLPIPAPLALGMPSGGYPWRWSIYRWIDGEVALPDRIADLPEFADSLGQFLQALQQADAAGGPAAGQHNFHRGGSLQVYDEQTRQAIAILADRIDGAAATAIWDAALATRWSAPPVWVHGDVSCGNLLVQDGRLGAVIDFGSTCLGDPACDLAIAWTLFKDDSRAAFRARLPLDADTWARGRAWTLWKALIVAAGLVQTNAVESAQPFRVIGEVLGDNGQS